MTEPTTAQMREWFDNAGPASKVRYQWIGVLLGRLDSKQAKIDMLMLEYCPDEMTEEQMDEWDKHQRPVI